MKTKEIINPEIGMGVTLPVGSDSYPYTIHKVEDDKKIWISADIYKWNPASNDYDYSNKDRRNPNIWEMATLRKDGYWYIGNTMKRTGRSPGHEGMTIFVGKRRYHRDPSF